MGIVVVITIPMSALQLMTPPEMRARVLSIRMTLSFGLVPIASLAIGVTAQLLGTPNAILVNGTLLALGSAGLLALRPGLRAWQSAGPAGSNIPAHAEPRVSQPVATALDA